ncbi:hypothetical protein Q4561_07765 [Alteromonas sp. 1_MG-2023]|uniref:hypothetical protein n=1 Tax=Alteromonas sp. 1_MG-2023 TaxID=3062669 RepID=UPI0026E30AC8|nr:hypothetical protein [Alteromonas sp. 1_MG-2023]MDO6566953.1 hypothetical protein [Alteromonas sp. 1_MG-2023]
MERVVQHAAKYLAAAIGFLVILAIYFFFKMNQSLSADQSYIDNIIEENEALTVQSAELESKLSTFSEKVAQLEENITEKQSTIERIQQEGDGEDLFAKCEALPPSNELVSAQEKLQKMRERQQSCSIALDKRNDDIRSLETTVKNLRNSSSDLEDAESATQELRDQLAEVREENERLLALSEQGSADDEADSELQAQIAQTQTRNEELTAQLNQLETEISRLQNSNTSSMQALESELAQANTDNSRLKSLLEELQGESEGSSTISGELKIVEFKPKINYCSDSPMCVDTVDISVKFNFRPGGFITIRVVGPAGNTIDRQSISGRVETQITVDFDSEDAVVGDYTMEFSTNDVLNPLKVNETFVITPGN